MSKPIGKEKIVKKYHFDKSHLIWQPAIDNWYSVEAFRQQTGKLPNEKDAPKDTLQVFMDFLDNEELHLRLLANDALSFGSMYLSSKRWIFRNLNGLTPLDK